ncbi:conjugative transposon TraM protein [Bacteroides fragilis str. 3998T(B)3]|uniref:Conjugative transposon TraM protein n=1 Tax=Bacteroides fragilis str. 3998T(B)3 TaxID=1339316 RepID=A0A015TZH0_BACFG|nr:conjugative transposon protein TraM [Bacteroides fragilis]EXY87887.1 conjugative transposon TraM protein [Bacteroides fragilis str. 3998T(B)3]
METKEQKNESRTKEKKPLTEQQRQQRQKMLVYPLMVLLFAGGMWLIFAPSSEDKEKERQGQGFNTDMPMPEDSKIIGDKAKAYEQQDLENKRKERRGMVGDLSAFWNDSDGDTPTDDADTSDDYRLTRTETTDGETADERQAGIRTSAAAYQRLNTSLGTFYEPPKEDTEKEELRERIDELEAMLVAQDSKPSTMEEQVALLEKSYELAAKYQNDNNAGQAAQPDETGGSVSTGEKSMKAEPVSDVRRTVVSALPQPMTDSAFIADYSGERNYGFHTAIGAEETTGKNTIAACVQGDQTLTDGQTVKLRLLEPMRVSGRVIPRNTLLVGAARLQGERLGIGITSLEHGGNIIPVELEVYDSDGQAGIFIPGSMEIDAAKEIGANMGSSLGSSINISTDAGAQLASDLGRGAIQGISQYISKRMRTVKVHLKSGYRVLLYQEKE